jgi:hypothetical protein
MEHPYITEPAILVNLHQLYRPNMSVAQLYDTTRGVWKVNKQRASRADLAFAVADGKVVEIYDIHQWHAANTTPYLSGRQDQSNPKHAADFEFTGKIAPAGIKSKYLGLSVRHLFGRGQNPIRYLNC